jgi:hypothetical protein
MPPKRQIPPRVRAGPNGLSDSSVIIIACEGRKTEKKYFEDLTFQYHNSRVRVFVLEKLDNRSSPEDVLQQLDDFVEQFELEEDDMLWLVADRDRWKLQTLSTIARQCYQKKYQLAISNPAFEFWLLLHLKDIQDYSPEEQIALFRNKKDNNRSRLEKEIIDIVGTFNKSNLHSPDFLANVEIAIQRARLLDIHPDHRWPNQLGTRVYLLADIIIRQKKNRT